MSLGLYIIVRAGMKNGRIRVSPSLGLKWCLDCPHLIGLLFIDKCLSTSVVQCGFNEENTSIISRT